MKEEYNVAYNKWIEIIKNNKQKLDETIYDSMNSLLNIGGKNYRNYNFFVESSEERIISSITEMAFEKMKKNKKLLHEERISNDIIGIIDNIEKTGIIFSSYSKVGYYSKKQIDGKYGIENLIIVVVANPNKEATKYLFDEVNEFNKKANICVTRYTIKEFWTEYFGIEEYNDLVELINKFNEDVNEISGFSTILTPNENNLKSFRKKVGEELREYDYLKKVPEDIYYKQKMIMYNNYIGKELWKAMISENNFAISFLTSEWQYKIYKMTESLDLTNVICGYLKSVEQLLWAIIKMHKDYGLTIRNKNNTIVEFCMETEEKIDTTLGSLENALEHNKSIFDVNEYAQKYIINMIKEWRTKERNGYFHKDVIQKVEKVKEIRENVLYLYFLILGSCDIKEGLF